MAVIAAFGIPDTDPDFHFANDGVLAPEWEEQADLVRELFTFAVVRNPWDRFVSGWQYCRSTRQRSLAAVLRRPPMTGHDYRHVTRSQCATLYRPDGTLAVDHLIRYERLQEGFDEVCDILAMPRVALAPHNVGDRPPYQEVFDARTRRLFARRYRDDIERLGYEF